MKPDDMSIDSTDNVVVMFGIPINAVTMEQALDYIEEAIARNGRLHISVVNSAKVVNMQQNPSLRYDILTSDLVLADGQSIVWASKFLGKALPERVSGIDLMYRLFEHGHRVFCLGATEDVSQKVEEEIARNYPKSVLAGRRNGYFSAEEEEGIAKEIAASKSDILMVAISSPKKEQFMAKWKHIMQVPVVHGVGGSFDVMAGKVERAPEHWQQLGLEWLYRVKQEPRRLWKRYLVTNTWFIWLLLKAMVEKYVFGKSMGN